MVLIIKNGFRIKKTENSDNFKKLMQDDWNP